MISVYIRENGEWQKVGNSSSWKMARLLMAEWISMGYRVVAKTLVMQEGGFFAR